MLSDKNPLQIRMDDLWEMTSGFQLNNVEPPFFEWGHRAKLRGCMCGRHDSLKRYFLLMMRCNKDPLAKALSSTRWRLIPQSNEILRNSNARFVASIFKQKVQK